MKRRRKVIGHLDFALPIKNSIKKQLLNFHLFAIKTCQNHIYHDTFGVENVMFDELGIMNNELKYNNTNIILANNNAIDNVFGDNETLIGS